MQTARAIAQVINRNADAFLFRAIYDESDPGTVVVSLLYPGSSMNLVLTGSAMINNGATTDAQTTNQSSIVFATNTPAAFTVSATVNSVRKQNQIINSDQLDPDSFPIINTNSEGVAAEAIVKLLPIAETLLVVKDDSIRRLDSTYSSQFYSVSLSCRAPRSFARLGEQWIGLFTRGFVALSGSQPSPIGRQIDRGVVSRYGYGELIPSITGDGTNVDNYASGAANDVIGTYVCRFNRGTFVYNAFSQSWGMMDFVVCSSITQPSWFGSYSDVFLASRPSQPRSMLLQRDIRRTAAATSYFEDFSEVTYTLTNGAIYAPNYGTVVASITVVNNMSLPPVEAWAGSVVPGAFTVQSAVYGSITSTYANIYFTLASGFTSGFDSASILLPIRMRVQYAASLKPGSLSTFGNVLATIERSYLARTGAFAGSLTCNFYNRRDCGDIGVGALPPIGDFAPGYGIKRENLMSEIVPIGSEFPYSYFDMQRFAAPAERATDQQLVLEFISQQALQPIAIKSVAIEMDPSSSPKVTQ